jgi:radical SAM superfamily enzyme YgiQ (UPF0313 family)
MKVMLMNPPVLSGNAMVREGRCMQRKGAWTTLWPPLTLATLAALLKEEGHTVFARDYVAEDCPLDLLLEDIRNFNPQLIVMNTVAASLYNDISVAEVIKKQNPSIYLTFIGLHATAVPESVFNSGTAVDSAIIGEPDNVIINLANALQNNTPLDKIKNIAFRNNGTIIKTKIEPCWIDIDTLPMPAWEFFDIKKYLLPFSRKPFLLVTTSRGCPYDCTFCPIWIYYGKTPRFRSPKKIVDEIEYDVKKFGITDFLFWSESFTLNEEHVRGICNELLDRGLKINWMCNSRVDNVNPEMLALMKMAGCWLIGYGVESGNQKMLDSVNKKITLEKIREAIEIAHREGITVIGHIIIGLPGETEETIKETIKFSIDSGLDFAQFYCAVPFPGSKLYDDAIKNNWLQTNDWTQFEQNRSVLNYDGLTHSKIEMLRSEAIRRFYLRPHSVKSLLKVIYNHGDIFSFFRSLKEFLSWI